VQTIVLLAFAWGIIALLFFLLFSVAPPGQERPEWYGITTYVLEEVAFLGAGILCFRNWRSPQIVSGRTVWLLLGLGVTLYFIGNLFFGYWELGLHIEPDISPGDFFFIPAYICLGWGMLLAVISRQLNLTPIQWAIVVGIALAGIVLAYVLAYQPEHSDSATAPAVEQVSPSPLAAAPTAPGAAPSIAPAASPTPEPPAEEPVNAPAWAVSLENFLAPFAGVVSTLYIVGDIILVVMATMLLLAFWGGRFSLSWRFIAAAAFSYYIADMWFNYATSYIPDYQTGSLPEVCWIFSGCLFAIGAALEYDLSTRSRRSSRRRA
jgi:hypothetical protein